MDSIIHFRKQPKSEIPVAETIITQQEEKAITKKDLRDDWLNDPDIKNGIQILVDLINLGFKISTKDSNVSTDLSIIDSNTSIIEYQDRLVRDAFIFGTEFTKYLFNKEKKKIVGLWNMDGIRTDFFRDQQGNIKLDKDGKPHAFIEEIPFGYETEKSMEADEYGRYGTIYKNDRIIYFLFENLPGSIEGVSRLRAVHGAIRNKWKVEKGIAQASNDFGVPVWKCTIGNKDRPMVVPDTLSAFKRKMQQAARKQVIILPWWENVEILYPKEIGNLYKNLEPFKEQIPPGLGVPRSLIFQTGERTSRGTLRQENMLFISRIEKLRKKVIAFWYKQLFTKMADINTWKSLPTITFKPVTLEDVQSFSERMERYIKSEILSPEEIKDTVRRVEELDEGGII